MVVETVAMAVVVEEDVVDVTKHTVYYNLLVLVFSTSIITVSLEYVQNTSN